MFRTYLLICCVMCSVSHTLAQDAVTFRRRAPQIGDRIQQQIQCHLDAERSITQQRQLVDKTQQQLTRRQQRILQVTALHAGNPSQASIQYGASDTQVQSHQAQTVKITQPVANRTYIVSRQADTLQFLNADGSQPTEEELTILRQHLENFGKPNPLAAFLDGKQVRVGEKLTVPQAVAAQLLGLTGNQGNVDPLTLTLSAVEHRRGQPIAVFSTLLRTSNDAPNQMTMLMKGQLVIAANTCHTQRIELRGPVVISETRGPVEGRFQVSTNGNLHVQMQATPTLMTAGNTPALNR